MSVFNRRNAILGWAAWTITKQVAKSKARRASSVDGGTVRFSVPDLPGSASFAGTLAADGSAIGGIFAQNGGRYPLVLRRT